MAEERHLRLIDIEIMTGRPSQELIRNLPPPSLIAIDGDAVCVWASSEVEAFLKDVTTDALTREKNELTEDLHNLRQEIDLEKRHLRFLNSGNVVADASIEQGTVAYWPWVPPIDAPKRIQGVYRLMQDGKTVYIGQSVNIHGRVAEHATQKDFDQFSYARVDGDRNTLNEIESALIIVERPPGNHGADGKLRHPTGQGWTQEEALAVLDKYRAAISDAERDAA